MYRGSRGGQHKTAGKERSPPRKRAPVGLGDIVEDEVADLSLNVGRLVSDGDFGQAGQVDQSQVENVGREDFCAAGRESAFVLARSAAHVPRNNLLRWIGNLEMPLLPPATRSVSFSISLRISPKSWYLLSVCKNSPYSCGTASPTPPGRVNCGFVVDEEAGGGGGELRDGGVWTSWRTSGRRVTMPWPRGRKSRPTILCR